MAKKKLSDYKKFGKRGYFLYDSGFNYSKAQSKAMELKKKGFYVRVVRTEQGDRGFAIYRRHKTAL